MNAARRWLATWGVPLLLLGLALGLSLQTVAPSSLPQLWRGSASIGVLAIAMTAIMLTGGIDLSVGSIVALSSVTIGLLSKEYGWPVPAALAGAVVVGMLAGLGNGVLVLAGIAPLVATLATMALYRGIAMALVNGRPIGGLPDSLSPLAWDSWLGLPYQVYFLLVISLLFYIVVHHTWIGRALYAMGENRQASEFAGLPVRRIEFLFFVLSGTVAGLVAIPQTAMGAAAAPNAATGFELQAIACVVLGGTRVTGGFGSIARTLIGLATLAHLQIGFRLLSQRELWIPGLNQSFRLDPNIDLIILGSLVILVAVVNERLAPRRRS